MPAPRRRTALAATLLPLVGFLLAAATPAYASSTANEVVYAADTGTQDGFYDVVLLDPATRAKRTVLPSNPAAGISYNDPELSPDGSRIAVTQFNYGGTAVTGSIVVVNRDGTGLQSLTAPAPTGGTSISDVNPAWSPDGTTVLFTRSTATPPATGSTGTTTYNYALETVPAAGGAVTPVPGGDNAFSAAYDPTGTKIVYAAVQSGQDSGPLTVMNTDGTGKVALGPVGALPAWSPDGSTIAFATVTDRDPTAAHADVAQIATVPATGGAANVFAVTRPTSARTVAEYPAWAPDGESLLYDFYAYNSTGSPLPGDLWSVDKFGSRAGPFLTGAGDVAQPQEQGPPPSSVTAGTPSRFRPVTPQRILDTRTGLGAPQGKVPAKAPLVLQVGGVQTDAGPVPANATAVILNVTVTNVTAATDVRVYPSDAAIPLASNLNAAPGQTVPNLVTATLSASGTVSLLSSGGSVDLIADIAGWYTPTTGDSGFTSLDPRRILDTRSPAVGVPAARKVTPTTPVDLQVTGTLPTANGDTVTVPTDATAVVLNVTATGASASTDVRVYPTPTTASPPPTVSNLNLTVGQTTPNLVTVAVGSGGQVRLYNASGAVDLIADIAGYYSASGAGSYVPVLPLRFLDTRTGVGSAATPVLGAQYADLKVAGTRGVPVGALAAVVNLTATGVTETTDVRAYPTPASGGVLPTVSNLNLVRGLTRANLAIVQPGFDGRIRIRNAAGGTHLIGDLAGYFI